VFRLPSPEAGGWVITIYGRFVPATGTAYQLSVFALR